MTLTIGGLSLGIGLLLGLLGGGGSILTVPMLVYLAGMDPKAAIATSLLVVGLSSGVATLPHARLGNVCWRAGAAFGLAAMAGAYVGGRLAALIPGQLLMQMFGVMMLVTACAMLFKRRETEANATSSCPRSPWILWAIAIQGGAVGCLTGLIGAGGGFLIVPALTLMGGLSMRAAIGTSLLIITANAFAGLTGYLNHVQIDPTFAGGVTTLTVLGSLFGSRLAPHVSSQALRSGFGLCVSAIALYILHRELDLPLLVKLLGIHKEFWLGVLTVISTVLLYRLSAWLKKNGAQHHL
ncbi:MAG: sulfite exporter TauE/SafE family protein [Methylococcaceae bacterium]|nr:MAG: sulfite exporter TauE/SafE family protein [Methylococcaceae bacterium]